MVTFVTVWIVWILDHAYQTLRKEQSDEVIKI